MTQDEIIELARKAGFDTDLQVFKDGTAIAITLAKLVDAKARAKEREACAAVAREWVKAYPHPSGIIANNIMARGEA